MTELFSDAAAPGRPPHTHPPGGTCDDCQGPTGPDATAPAESTGEVPPAQHPDTGPAALAQGTFALYDDGRGGLVLVVQPVGQEIQRKHIPAAAVKMGQRVLGQLFGG